MDVSSFEITMSTSKKKSVALLIETSNEYARGLLRGILRYQQEHDRWSIDMEEQQRGAAPPTWLKRYDGDGIIARIETEAIAKAVRAANLPTVDVSAARHLPGIPWVETDDAAVAEAAVAHFEARGLRNVAFCCEIRFNWGKWRRDSFLRVAEARGLNAQAFNVGNEDTGTTWPRERRRLQKWLEKLPQPCGVLASYDSLARRVLEVCDEAGLQVPEQLAVMGVDNDPLLCQFARPPLTSIIPDSERAGYVAAEILDSLMNGGTVEETRTLMPPRGVATRRSTDVLAVDDPEVAAAAQYILAHACDGIRVNDVVRRSSLTRRVLETRFKEATGQTPHELITSTRVARAEQLLRESTLTLTQIAHRVGLEHAEYLSVLFRKHRGKTPGSYRR